MRTGDWTATFTGKKFFLLDPHPDDVDIVDIAHALSHICRFGGMSVKFYSVAQHSLYCAEYIFDLFPDDPLLQFHALMHDASEAYLGDMVRPLKLCMPDYKAAEARMEAAILQHFKLQPLTPEQKAIIKDADKVMLMTERRDLVNNNGFEWRETAKPWKRTLIAAADTSSVKSAFLFLARSLLRRMRE